MHSVSPQKALSVAFGLRFMTQSLSMQQSADVVHFPFKGMQPDSVGAVMLWSPFESPFESSASSARAASVGAGTAHATMSAAARETRRAARGRGIIVAAIAGVQRETARAIASQAVARRVRAVARRVRHAGPGGCRPFATASRAPIEWGRRVALRAHRTP